MRDGAGWAGQPAPAALTTDPKPAASARSSPGRAVPHPSPPMVPWGGLGSRHGHPVLGRARQSASPPRRGHPSASRADLPQLPNTAGRWRSASPTRTAPAGLCLCVLMVLIRPEVTSQLLHSHAPPAARMRTRRRGAESTSALNLHRLLKQAQGRRSQFINTFKGSDGAEGAE